MKTKLILFITVFLLSASLKSQNAKIKKDYKNALSVDVGSFAMLNYHRRIFRKNWYALNGQVGVGFANPKLCNIDLLLYLNGNVYINNLFTVKKHTVFIGFGVNHILGCSEIELMSKIGYQYNIFRHITLNFTLYHHSYFYKFEPLFSFGINYNF